MEQELLNNYQQKSDLNKPDANNSLYAGAGLPPKQAFKQNKKMKKLLQKEKKKYTSSYSLKDMMKGSFENASVFVNVSSVDDDGNIHLKSGEIAQILMIDAVDLSLSSNLEQEAFIDGLKYAYQINNVTIKGYKLDKPINLNMNKDNLIEKIRNLYEDDPKRALLIQEYNDISLLEEKHGTLSSSYYYVVIAKDINLCSEKRQDLESTLSNLNIRVNTTFIKNRLLIYQILSNIYLRNNTLDDLLWSDTVDLLAPYQAQEETTHIKFNDDVIQCVSVKSIPRFLQGNFIDALFNVAGVRVSMTIKDSMTPEELTKYIDQQYKFLLTDRNTTRNLSDATDLDYQEQQMQNLMADIKVGGEKIKEVSIVMIITGTKAERDETYKILKEIATMYNVKLDIPKMRQMEAWQTYELTTRSFKEYSFYLPTKTLAYCYFFTKNNFNDTDGFLLGEDTHTGLPVFWNPFTLNDTRTAHNIAIIGTTGAGKSYTMKKILIDEFARGTKILIFDAEHEYEKIVRKNHGEYIDLSDKGGGVINPLQVRFLASEDTEDSSMDENSFPLDKHLGFLEVFFKTAFEEITEKELVVLLKIVEDLYKEKGIFKNSTVKQLQMFNPNQYPTFTDLVNFIPVYEERNKSDVEISVIEQLKVLMQRFVTGQDANLFNGYTNIDLSNPMIAFNLQELLYSQNRRLINTQVLNLLSYINNAVVQNKINNAGERDISKQQHIMLVADEFHLFIDAENPIILKNFAQLARRIRKYSGSLVVTTQSIKDFVNSNAVQGHAQAIFNNCQYTFVGILREADMLAYVDLFKNNPLTETQQEFLLNAHKGDFLLNVDTKERLRIHILGNQLEEQMMGERD